MRVGSAVVLSIVLSAGGARAEPSTRDRLELLERRIGQITDLTLQLDQARDENRKLRGELERLGYEIEQLKRKQRDMYLDIDQRLGGAQPGALASGGGVDSTDVTPTVSTAGSVGHGAAVLASADQIRAEYDAAYALLSPKQKRYGDAAKAFAQFVKKYPNDALAPNAQYWLGEAYYVSQRNADALKAFETVATLYPNASKAPDALFKIGRLQQARGNASGARASYEKVINDYPDSAAVGLARKWLDNLRR